MISESESKDDAEAKPCDAGCQCDDGSILVARLQVRMEPFQRSVRSCTEPSQKSNKFQELQIRTVYHTFLEHADVLEHILLAKNHQHPFLAMF